MRTLGHRLSGLRGPVGSFAQRKDQKQDLTCKEVPLAAFLTLLTRGSCSAKGGHWGQGQRLGGQSGQESKRKGAAGGCGQLVRAGRREGGEERNSQHFSPTLLPGPLEEFTDGRKTGRRTELVDRSGAQARSRWAANDQRASQRGHQGGTWMTGPEFQEQPRARAMPLPVSAWRWHSEPGDRVRSCQKNKDQKGKETED